MNIEERYITKNWCYTNPKSILVEKLILHSPGVGQPDPSGMIERMNTQEEKTCVHAFITLDKIMQLLPWDFKANHVGSGINGSYNNRSIGVEMCEPAGHTYKGGTMIGYDSVKNADYFTKIYSNAVELFAKLCSDYHLDPLQDILCHSEVHKLGYGSNHSDVMQWLPKHSKTMDMFREDVKKRMAAVAVPVKSITLDSMKEDIKWAQEKYNELLPEIPGIIPLKIDGDYGPKTRIATLIYWDMIGWGKHMKDDGTIIGKATIEALAAGKIK